MCSITYKFRPIKARRVKTGKCPVCGGKTFRKSTFEQFINPFNKNKKGEVKSWNEVLVDVNAEADRWKPDFRHEKCK